MGTFGVGAFDNDAANDWFGFFEKLGFLAVVTPLSAIGEYVGMAKEVPAETEQAFWAACETIAIAGGEPASQSTSQRYEFSPEDATKILNIPNLRERILWGLGQLDNKETELESLWLGSGDIALFRGARDDIKKRVLSVLSRA